MEAALERFPDLWLPGRSDLCFATTNRQAALREIAGSVDAVVVIGSANSSNTVALEKVATAPRAAPGWSGSTAPTRSRATSRAPSGSPPGPRPPSSWSRR